MPGIGSPWMKLRTNSSASGRDGLLSFSTTAFSRPSLQIQPLPIQFRRREAEAGDAVDLGEERREASFDAALGDERVERRRLLRRGPTVGGRFRRRETAHLAVCAISSSRADSMPPNNPSTICRR